VVTTLATIKLTGQRIYFPKAAPKVRLEGLFPLELSLAQQMMRPSALLDKISSFDVFARSTCDRWSD
jgi:hypothetical protein